MFIVILTTKPKPLQLQCPLTCSCCSSEAERDTIHCSEMIDRQLRQQKLKPRKECKILLLGCGDVGKSTFVKQMNIIYGEGYSKKDRLGYRSLIYSNILDGTRRLIDASQQLQSPLQHSQNELNCEKIFSGVSIDGDDDFQSYVEPLMAVWKDGAIKHALNRRNQFQLVSVVLYHIAGNIGRN